MSEDAQECLSELMSRFHERLNLYGCISRVGPLMESLLENEIAPIFALDRWATGPSQLDKHSYNRLYLALRLATLFLTEDCTLAWFAHYTYGRRKTTASGRTYISPTQYSQSEEARDEVRSELHALGKDLSLMLRPAFGEDDEEYDEEYGATYCSTIQLPFFHLFHEFDWALIARPHRHHPIIVLHNDFHGYFSQSLEHADVDTWLRTQFLFATTLVHEVCHAYSMWLNIEQEEPLFRKGDIEAELGYSWETEVLGYICNPIFHDIAGCDDIVGCTMLLSMRAIAYRDDSSQPAIVRRLIGNHPLHFNLLDPAHYQDLFQLQSYRGGTFYAGEGSDPHRKWIIAIYALSMD